MLYLCIVKQEKGTDNPTSSTQIHLCFMNYGNLSERAIKELKEIGCYNATTNEQAINYIEKAFIDYRCPIGIDDEDNPTEIELDYGSDSNDYYLKDYASVEEMFNAFVIDACGVVAEKAGKMWDDDHTAYYTDTCCGNYSDTQYADSVAECVDKYYGRL